MPPTEPRFTDRRQEGIRCRAARGHVGRARETHSLVVGLGRDLTGLDIALIHGLLVRRVRGRPVVRRRGPSAESRSRPPGSVACTQDTDTVGQSEFHVRNLRPAFHQEDLRVSIRAGALGNSPRSHSADDDEFHIYLFRFQFVFLAPQARRGLPSLYHPIRSPLR
jgi:hypothetical protein